MARLGEARKVVVDLLEDQIYQANLRKRLQTGEIAPQLEILLWHYRFGKPADQLVVREREEDLSGKSNEELANLARELESFLRGERRTNDAVLPFDRVH